MTKGDKALISGIVLMALIFFAAGQYGKTDKLKNTIGIIRARGKIVKEVDLALAKNQKLSIKGHLGISTVKLTDGKIEMLSSPCKDKLCIKQGQISASGQTIVCVPNEVSISIEKKGELDEITR